MARVRHTGNDKEMGKYESLLFLNYVLVKIVLHDIEAKIYFLVLQFSKKKNYNAGIKYIHIHIIYMFFFSFISGGEVLTVSKISA